MECRVPGIEIDLFTPYNPKRQVVEVPDDVVCMAENCCISEQLEGKDKVGYLSVGAPSAAVYVIFAICLSYMGGQEV